MPFYDTTGSYTGSCGILVTLVIPPGMMLTGTYTFFLETSVTGTLTGSFFGEGSEISGSLSGSVSGSAVVPVTTASFYGGPLTGSFTGSFYGNVIITIPPGMMLTGTVIIPTSGSDIRGNLSGSVSGSTSTGLLTGTLNGDVSGTLYSSPSGIAIPPIGGPYTGTLVDSSFSGVVTLVLPSDKAIVGSVQFPITGTVGGLVSGNLTVGPGDIFPFSGNVQSNTLTATFVNMPSADSTFLKSLGSYEDSTRLRRSYPFFRPRSKKVRYIIE